MRDHTAHIVDVFKNALAAECTANGIDHKSEAGYWVGGGGAVTPMVLNGELQGFGPTWMFGFSLRSLLIGQEPVAGALPIHNVLPSDGEIKAMTKRLVTDISNARTMQFKGTE